MKKLINKSIFGIIFILALVPAITNAAVTLYVNPDEGNDSNTGISIGSELETIQKAIDLAQPGDTIELSSGEYFGNIVSKRNGSSGSPITINGPADAVVKGGGNDRVIEINHDYHTLNGFTVNGLYKSNPSSSAYRDTLIYALGKDNRDGVDGLKILNMTLKNAGGECIRLRYFATKAEIAYNTITDCGVYDFVYGAGGKNGEGIYLGTSSNQWDDGKNPTNDPDESRDNHIHHNTIVTNGNECVDIKEGATANIVENNTCRGQRDSESGGFGSRGSGNIFRYNDVQDSLGAGIRLGGWKIDGIQYGVDNDIYENTIKNNKNGGIKFQETPQGKVCENIMSGNTGGDAVGSYASNFNPTASCSGIPTPPPPPSPSPTPPPSQSPSPTPPPPSSNTGSLAKNSTLVSDSKNFSSGYGPSKLWDGCYTGSSYNSNTCTTGGRDMASFWLEFDFGKLYDLSEIRLYGDKDGEWVSKTWTLKYKKNSGDSWTTNFSSKNAFINDWSIQSLNIKARFVRIEVFGDSNNSSPGQTQARELEIYGTESANQTVSPPPPPPPSSGGGGGSGGSLYVAPVQISNTAVITSNSNVVNSNKTQTGIATKVILTKSLYLGISNSETTILQTFLASDNTIYPEGLITGYFGNLTREAIKRFQCRHNIVCSGNETSTGYGRVGPSTRAKLNELMSDSTTTNVVSPTPTTSNLSNQLFINQLFFGLNNNDVSRLQTFLASDNTIYPEGLITGYFGNLTREAIKRFQCRHNIVCSGNETSTGYGRVGPATLAKLNTEL
jgi:peptidoglycan hydrolase-like protein with peptidoglycan-binding domain